MKKALSQRALARLAGVSQTTVSLALRGHSSIPSETAARIQELARQQHYHSDPTFARVLGSLRRSRDDAYRGTIAFLHALGSPKLWRSISAYRRYFAGAEKRAEAHGYRLEPFWFDTENQGGPRLSDILRARGIEGVIVAPLKQAGSLEGFAWNHFAIVAIGQSLQSPAVHRVANYGFQSVRLAVQHLHRLGYTRIGLIENAEHDEKVDHEWQAGFLAPSTRGRPVPPPPFLYSGKLVQEDNRDRLVRWYWAHLPDAILFADHSLVAMLNAMVPAAEPVPFLVHLDWSPTLSFDRVHECQAGIDQNAEQIGAVSFDVLEDLMTHNEKGAIEHPHICFIEGQWVDFSDEDNDGRENRTPILASR